MPPRNRRLVAREQPEEEEEAQDGPMNSSLRSFFPIEIVKLILQELGGDLPSLASVCLVSFGCLEEASGELYRDAVVKSEQGMVSFFCGAKLKPSSRLIPHLAIHQVQTLSIHCENIPTPSPLLPHLVQRGGVFPPRLRTILPLTRLSIYPLPDNSAWNQVHGQHCFDDLTIFVLPHLSPVHLTIASSFVTFDGSLYTPQINWSASLRAWTSLSTIHLSGKLPIKSKDGRRGGGRFFLEDAACLRDGREVELTVDLRGWGSWGIPSAVREFQQLGVFGLEGLRCKVMVKKDVEEATKTMIQSRLSDVEQERLELVGQD